MNNFIYDIPVKVYFGQGQLHHLGEELKKYGTRVLLTYGGGSIKRIGLYDKVVAELKRAGMEIFELSGIEPNPKIGSVREGVRICKENNIDVTLAVGGGSVIDATKFIAAGACVDFDAWDFFNEKRMPIKEALPIITILTLSATGSEMDSAGVISNPETREKKPRMEDPLLPKVSFLDPTNTFSVNRYQTACGAADTLSHLFEFYFSKHEDLSLLDGFMEEMMRTVIRYSPVAIAEPENYEARANLMWAATWAINGFINGGKPKEWCCHPMEHELSAIYDIAHGMGLAILTPRWMKYVLDESTVFKFVQFGANVFGLNAAMPEMALAEKAIDTLSEFLFVTLGLPRTFTEIGIKEEDFPLMAERACKGGTLPGFRPLDRHDIENIYRMCL